MTTGIHHVTALTRDVQRNVDFYAGFLGLRLVKQTGGYEDAEQLHLFYGDRIGSPGSIITFLVWQEGARGRVGLGQVSEIGFAVPPASIGGWMQRAIAAGVPVSGPAREMGETVLRLRDPDGLTVKLVGVDLPTMAPLEDSLAPTRIRSVTILTDDARATAAFTERFGYRKAMQDGPHTRMASETDVIDLRQSAGFVTGGPGTGVFDHVAFRAPDAGAVRKMRLDLKDHSGLTNVHDRKYFLSLYVREPAGTLFEYATDAPGFTVDEAAEHLGETLLIPPSDTGRAQDLRVMLPQFARPGDERRPMRDLPFVHRFYTPEDSDGSVYVLLHGTGGNEADLMPLAARINARATLLGVRGRSTEEGTQRWFRRFEPERFDQNDINAEAAAFDYFVGEVIKSYGLDPAQLIFLGYSNGANFLGAVIRLHPGTIQRAIVLRGGDVLEETPSADLSDVQVLLLTGTQDPFERHGKRLETALTESGAAVTVKHVEAGHDLSPEDPLFVNEWLTNL
ncbi:VOC family protein [Leisingera sp.]|uniref:VOC family protein n=1 Tax=Leisingera sp. TaxID=1879318 RepID=UPI002B26E61A|nr:VOC family protein [Leisingera sp.]